MKRVGYYATLLLTIVILYSSCVGGRYAFDFDDPSLDFGKGKWILNETQSNIKPKYNRILYTSAHKEFKKIIGDSLFDLTSVRTSKVLPKSIKHNLSPSELQDLHAYTNCDFLINITGEITAKRGSKFTPNDPYSNYSPSDRTTVTIVIYDLKNGTELSSSKVNTIDFEEFDPTKDEGTKITLQTELMMAKATRKLIRKYGRHKAD